MAYVSKEMKENRVPAIKAVLKKYGMKGTISILRGSTLLVKLSAGKLQFADIENVNPYHIQTSYEGIARIFLTDLISAMKGPDWYDRSDISTDYFDIAYYIRINIGSYDKPYKKIE